MDRSPLARNVTDRDGATDSCFAITHLNRFSGL